jgi:uncharacterized membrane protein SpoIIM required for sporulation
MFVIGGMISVTCLFISFIVFPQQVGLFTTILITFAMTPFMVNLMTYDEALTEEEIAKKKEMNLLKRHKYILSIYTAFFIGMILALSILYMILPESIVQKLFDDQINEINLIRGDILFVDTFQKIIFNNVGVLFLTFLFSLLFGSGAIFILTWNASVLSTAIGLTAKAIGGLRGLPLAVLTYFPHGSLEILAYFVGGVAGGIVSAAISRRHSKWLKVIFTDSAMLLGIAILLLVFGAFIESASISLST